MSRIKEAFDKIQAEEALKENTRSFLAENADGQKRRSRNTGMPVFSRLVPAAACILLLAAGGYRVCFIPTSVISIDINPSLELGINRFDRVVSVEEYNDAGYELADSLDIRFMEYSEAIEQILASEQMKAYLSQDEWLSITVVDLEGKQGERILSGIEHCVAGHQNTSCHAAELHDVQNAHAEGLSYGKYCAFLELQSLDAEITAEDIQGLTMHEIQNLIRDLSEGDSGECQEDDYEQYDRHGNGHGNEHQSGHNGKKHGE